MDKPKNSETKLDKYNRKKLMEEFLIDSFWGKDIESIVGIEDRKQFITYMNYKFGTILSYGEGKDLIPAGLFYIDDIEGDLRDPYNANVIFKDKDDADTKIIMPLTLFKEYIRVANENDRKNLTASDIITATTVAKEISGKLEADDSLQDLIEAEVIPFEENGIIYIKNGKVQSTNYSICPISNAYLRIRERFFLGDEPDLPNNELKEELYNIPNKNINKTEKKSEEIIPTKILEPGIEQPEPELER